MKITSIPDEIRNNNSAFLTQTMDDPLPLGHSVGVAFSYVVSDEQKTSGNFDMLQIKRQIDLDTLLDPQSALTPGFTGNAYSRRCGDIVNAAVNGNAGASFPVGSAKAMLKAEFDTQTDTSLVVAIGLFTSPLARMERGDSGERLNRLLLLWDWYMRNPDQLGAANWMYNQFTGLTTYKMQDSIQSNLVNANLSVSASAPIGSFESNLSAQASSKTNDLANTYETFQFLPANASDLIPFPTPDALIAGATNIRLSPSAPPTQSATPAVQSQADNSSLLVLGKSFPFYQSVLGVPPNLCDSGDWSNIDQRSPGITVGTIELTDATASRTADQRPVCTFSFEFNPADSFSVTTDPAFTLDFGIRNTISGSTSKTLELNAAKVSISASKSPRFVAIGDNPQPTASVTNGGATSTQLSWTGTVLVDDSDNIVKGTPNPSTFSLTCGNSPAPLTNVAVTTSYNKQLVTVTTTYTDFVPNDVDTKNSQPSVACTLSVDLIFQMTTGPDILKSQSFSLLTYPKPAPTQPVVTPAPPQGPTPAPAAH